MLIRIKVIMVFVALLFATFGADSSPAQTNTRTEETRNKVAKYGVGKKVIVKLLHDAKFKGRISEIEKDTFSIKVQKSNTTKTFTYKEVIQVKKPSFTKWIVIGVAAAVAVAVIIPLSQRCRNEGRNGLCL